MYPINLPGFFYRSAAGPLLWVPDHLISGILSQTVLPFEDHKDLVSERNTPEVSRGVATSWAHNIYSLMWGISTRLNHRIPHSGVHCMSMSPVELFPWPQKCGALLRCNEKRLSNFPWDETSETKPRKSCQYEVGFSTFQFTFTWQKAKLTLPPKVMLKILSESCRLCHTGYVPLKHQKKRLDCHQF